MKELRHWNALLTLPDLTYRYEVTKILQLNEKLRCMNVMQQCIKYYNYETNFTKGPQH